MVMKKKTLPRPTVGQIWTRANLTAQLITMVLTAPNQPWMLPENSDEMEGHPALEWAQHIVHEILKVADDAGDDTYDVWYTDDE